MLGPVFREMKVVCAWCQKTLREPPPGELRISHGICPECMFRVLGAKNKGMGEFLDGLEIPVVVLDGQSRVIDLNGFAEKILGTTRSAVKGALPGPAISCYNAGLPGGCGMSERCPGCQLRQHLASTHADGQTRFNQTSRHEVVRDGTSRMVEFRFSTQKVGGVVMLLLEEVRDVPTGSG